MPRARKHLVCLSETPWYHVTSRCVRRAFLCGVDRVSGRSYEHRRDWLEQRIRTLSSLFSVQLCAYAIMSNHYHLVVRLNPDESDRWSDDEVFRRWTALYRGPLLVQRYLAGAACSDAEAATVRSMAAVYRQRLGCLSWFMKCLNEPIARRANKEDGCTGHFWEARFHSQPLRTEAALLTAMAYVDLNPIRAGIATSPEHSEYTSIRARIAGDDAATTLNRSAARVIDDGDRRHVDIAVRPLMPFADEVSEPARQIEALPMNSREYLKLVDQTGRIAVRGKRGRIDATLAPVLNRLGLTTDDWMRCSTGFSRHYRNGELRVRHSA